MIKEYRQQISEVQTNVSGKPFDEFRELQMQIRSLYGVVREQAEAATNDAIIVQREIDQLQRDKRNIIQQIAAGHKRMEKLEVETGAVIRVDDESEVNSELEIEK